MDIVFYRKIAEIVLRDPKSSVSRDIAIRTQASKRISKSDRRILRAYMMAYIDGIDTAWEESGNAIGKSGYPIWMEED
jgi:hypothetical protein